MATCVRGHTCWQVLNVAFLGVRKPSWARYCVVSLPRIDICSMAINPNPDKMRSAHQWWRKWRSDLSILYAARGVRGFGDGFAIVLLPAYLSATGFAPTQIGFIATASLLGTAALTLGVGLIAPRHDLRNLLLIGAGLMACTGAAFANFEQFALLAVDAFDDRPIRGEAAALGVEGRSGFDGVQGREQGLDRDPPTGHELAAGAPQCRRERCRPDVLEHQDPRRAAGDPDRKPIL